MATVKVKYDGGDITAKVFLETISVNAKLGRQMDICNLEIEDIDGLTSFDGRKELIVSNAAETYRYFGGYVADQAIDLKGSQRGKGLSKIFLVNAQDFTSKTDSRRIKKIYENRTEKYIIKDVFDTYLAGQGFNADIYVDTGVTIPYVTFDWASIRQILDEMKAASGRSWNIDYWKYVRHFNETTAPTAPFGLANAEGGGNYTFEVLEYKKDESQIRNKVLVKGVEKIYPADWYYFGKTGATPPIIDIGCDGVKKVFILPYKYLPPDDTYTHFPMRKNVGSEPPGDVWNDLLVGVEGTDLLIGSGGIYDVLWNADEKRLTFDTAPPNLYNSIEIYGRYTNPIEVWRDNSASIAKYGLWEDLIDDPNIATEGTAILVGDAHLVENADARYSLTVKCWQDGLDTGMKIHVTESVRGIDGDFIIQEMTTTFKGGEIAEYTLVLDTYKPDIIDILLKLQGLVGGASAGKIGGITSTGQTLELNANLANDHSFSGLYRTVTVAEVVTFGQPLYLNNATSKWHLADADAEDSTDSQIVMALEAGAADALIRVLVIGYVRDDSWSWTPSDPLVLSGVAGGMASMPGVSKWVKPVAVAETSHIVFFSPDLTLVEKL